MNKAAVYLIFALALGSLLFSSMSQGISNASYTIGSYGTIASAPPITSMEPKTVIVIYGTETLNAAQIANVANFDMLITGTDMSQSTLASIKALNPNIMILAYMDTIATTPQTTYWSTVNTHEDWFVHDNAGNRVINNYWGGWYLMNITSGWRQFYAQYANSLLSSQYVDGIFGDDVLNEIKYTIMAGVFSDDVTKVVLTTSNFPNAFLDNWRSYVVDFLSYAKNNMNSEKKFIINSEEYMTNDYLTLTGVDGKMAEGFAVKTDIMNSINGMARDSATGKIFIAETYVPTPTSTPTAKYSYVATLLAMNGDNCYFGYNAAYYYGYEGGANYMPVFVPNLGSPSGSYYQSQGIYMRDFTGGIVLFNPSDNSYTINLGDNYQLTNGTIVSSITLDPWSGEILLSHV